MGLSSVRMQVFFWSSDLLVSSQFVRPASSARDVQVSNSGSASCVSSTTSMAWNTDDDAFIESEISGPDRINDMCQLKLSVSPFPCRTDQKSISGLFVLICALLGEQRWVWVQFARVSAGKDVLARSEFRIATKACYGECPKLRKHYY
jgi:hypothetical protein